MLRLDNATFLYAPKRGVEGASLSAESGEVIGVVGGNGAGKSTLLGLIAAALVPQRGNVSLALSGMGGRTKRFHSNVGIGYRRHVGYMTEMAPVYEELSIRRYLSLRARLHGVGGFRLRACLREVMDACGLQQLRHERIGRLSLGLRRRVALAEALVSRPEVLVLDDPFSGIDAVQRAMMSGIIQKVAARSHIFISGHDPELLKMCCTRFWVLENARVVADETDADIVWERLSQAVEMKKEVRA